MRNALLTLLGLATLTACSESATDLMTAPVEAMAHNENVDFADAAPVRTYRVMVENITDGGQHFTPPLVAIHRNAFGFFEVGRPATAGIQQIAENGNLGPMIHRLEGSRHVSSFVVAASGEGLEGPLAPGESVTASLTAEPGSQFLSFASMLICTNDGFTGVSDAKLPNQIGEKLDLTLPAYDAGTEMNTQLFGDLVPPCPLLSGVPSTEPGSGMSDPALAEGGVVREHEGIGDYGDLTTSVHGWTGPVARLIVERIG